MSEPSGRCAPGSTPGQPHGHLDGHQWNSMR